MPQVRQGHRKIMRTWTGIVEEEKDGNTVGEEGQRQDSEREGREHGMRRRTETRERRRRTRTGLEEMDRDKRVKEKDGNTVGGG